MESDLIDFFWSAVPVNHLACAQLHQTRRCVCNSPNRFFQQQWISVLTPSTFDGDKMAKVFAPFNVVIARRASDAETKQTLTSDEHNSLTHVCCGTDQPPGTNLSFIFSVTALVRLIGVQPTSTDAGTEAISRTCLRPLAVGENLKIVVEQNWNSGDAASSATF